MEPRGRSKKIRVAKKRPVRNTRIKRINSRENPPEQSVEAADEVGAVGENFTCSTPKGREFRIPKLDTCPPAPMKRRLWGSDDVRSLKRLEGFFDPPDVELFFIFAGNLQA